MNTHLRKILVRPQVKGKLFIFLECSETTTEKNKQRKKIL